MEESISAAKKLAEDVLSFFGLNVDVRASHEDDVITLEVPSTHMNPILIGNRGETMMATQTLISNSLRSKGYEVSRVSYDVAGYKADHQAKLVDSIQHKITQALEEGVEVHLEPMHAADRRAVHKEVSDRSGVRSESSGQGRDRHIVIIPDSQADSQAEQD